MAKHKEYHIHWEGAERRIRVKAASFMGAMRAAFGPGQYEDAGALNEYQRRIKWPWHLTLPGGLPIDGNFIVSVIESPSNDY